MLLCIVSVVLAHYGMLVYNIISFYAIHIVDELIYAEKGSQRGAHKSNEGVPQKGIDDPPKCSYPSTHLPYHNTPVRYTFLVCGAFAHVSVCSAKRVHV